MSERNKEVVCAFLFFAAAAALGAYAIFGNMALGVMTLCDTKEFCAFWSFGCVLGGVIALIGNQRLNAWINPRLDAYSERRKAAKVKREALRAEMDLRDPDRITQREKRKNNLYCVMGWILLVSPLVAIIASIILAVYFKTEVYYMILAISALYAIQIWGLMLKTYLQMKSES